MATNAGSASRYILSLLRIVTAFLFMEHGAQKLFGAFGGLGGHTAHTFSLLWWAAILEFFGGLFMLFGLFTRVVAIILCGEMAFAYFRAHAQRGFWPLANHGELAILYCFVFLYFFAAGAGPLSLDRLMRKKA